MRHSLHRRFIQISIAAAFFTIARADSPFAYKEAMVPMRDGARLQTVILTPVKQKEPLPILLQRTPYGVPPKAPDTMPPQLKELADAGYIVVVQNLRGRFKSEGVFELSSQADLTNPNSVSRDCESSRRCGVHVIRSRDLGLRPAVQSARRVHLDTADRARKSLSARYHRYDLTDRRRRRLADHNDTGRPQRYW